VSANLVKFLYSSSFHKNIERIKANMKQETEHFFREKDLIVTQTQQAHNRELSRRLASSPPILTPASSMLTPSSSLGSVMENVTFPIRTIKDFQNYAFTGRQDDLAKIHTIFTTKPMPACIDPICVVLQGIGGVGKTQTALQYAYQHLVDYDAIFWVRSETDHELARTYASIAKKLKLGNVEAVGDTGRAVELARDWLEQTGDADAFAPSTGDY
jgi:hypothetical protein